MRSFILVILSALALAGMFMVYWTMQPVARSSAGKATPTPVFTRLESGDDDRLNNLSGLHPGDVVWFKQYDTNQNLTNAFEAKAFTPHPDGTVYVTSPRAEFFLANKQRIEVVGKDGNVVVKDPPDLRRTGMMNPGPAAPPSRGRINDVTITFYDESRDPAHQVSMIMTTNNVVFDNETYLIFTEGFRDGKGEAVPNDQVPVHLVHKDVESKDDMLFDGRGLTLRWNDTDGRLELLEVAHVDLMEIMHPGNFTPAGAPQQPRRRRSAPLPAALLPGRPLPEMLAAKDKKAHEEIIRHHPEPTTKPRRGSAAGSHASSAPVVYIASFYDQVVITQPNAGAPGDQLKITGDRMDVHFLMKQATSSTTRPAAQSPIPAAPALAPATPANPPAAPQTRPAAATQPTEQPVFVHCSGILRVVPEKSTPPVPLAPGDSAVTLVGAPVTVHRIDPAQQATEDVRCGSLIYQTAGEKVLLSKSPAYPQVLITDAPGPKAKEQRATRIESTGTVQYGRVEQKVLLTGPGHAEVPVESDEKDKHPLLQAAWTQQALFDLTRPQGDEQPTVRQAHFAGNVDVRHPRLLLNSQVLDLLFDPPTKPAPTTKPSDGQRQVLTNLRQVIAATNVACTVEDSEGKKQNIECQRLVLDTDRADDKLYPRHLNATGSVHAWGEDELRAGFLDVVMAPTKKKPSPKSNAPATKPAKSGDADTTQVELDSLLAKENVVAKSKDGSVAEGQELRVTTANGKQHVLLTSPSQAKVTDPQGNIVTGPAIEADPDEGHAHAAGPGSLHMVQQKQQPADPKKPNANAATADAKKPLPPTDVTWLGAADFNGPENRIDVTGSVSSRSVDRNGAVNTAVGDHMRIELRNKPKPAATQPVVAGAMVAGAPKKQRSATPGSAAKMDLFGNKEMVALRIENGASLTSTTPAPDGGILQQMQLNSTVIVIRELAEDGTPSRSLTVPAPGTMLVRDHRPPEKQPANSQAAGDDANAAGGARGATAFEWHKQLVYTESAHRADMTGQVRVVHQDEDERQAPVEVDAETVTSFFEPAPKKPPVDPRHPQPKKQEDDGAPQLKLLTATGPTVQVIRRSPQSVAQMIAQRIDYDPKKHILTATGSPRNPVIFDNGGVEQTSAESASWDTITWTPTLHHIIAVFRPPTPATQPAQPTHHKK